MRKLTFQEIKQLSFPDFSVDRMNLSSEDKTLTIVVEGGIINGNDVEILKNCELKFENWVTFKAKFYNDIEKKWVRIQQKEVCPLKELNEFLTNNNNFILRGFNLTNGKWTEYKIINPQKILIKAD